MSENDPQKLTRICTHTRTADGLLIARMNENTTETLADAQENGQALLELKGNDPQMPILVDFSLAAGQDSASRKYYAENSGRWCTKAAILIKSPVSKVMGNIYMGLNKPKVPTKLFTDESEALAWLKET